MRDAAINVWHDAIWRFAITPVAALIRKTFLGALTLGRNGGRIETFMILAGVNVEDLRARPRN